MKKTKIIIPALGMLLLSTAASVTGTVAWFSMNNFVNATQMKVTAKADSGIVISNASNGTFTEEVTAAHNTGLDVYPTSTATTQAWFRSTSSRPDQANTGNAYELLTIVEDASTGAGYVNDNGQADYQGQAGTTTGENPVSYDADSAFYLVNSFYIKSSAEVAIQDATLYITKIVATAPETPGSAALNKALRVLVKLNGENTYTTAKVYAPFRSANVTNTVVTALGTPNTTTSVTAVAPGENGIVNTTFLENQTIPAFSSSPLRIDVYLYYEGEDEECKSENLTASLDELQVSVEFGTQQRATA